MQCDWANHFCALVFFECTCDMVLWTTSPRQNTTK